MAENIRRVLVVKLSSIGDLLHALPAVRCLKAGLQAEIDWIVHPAYAELAGCFADVSRVLEFPRRASLLEFTRRLRALRLEQYDLVADLQGILKSALVARAVRSPRRIGPSFHREFSSFFYTGTAGPRDKNRHAVFENMDLARCLGLPLLPPAYPVSAPLQLAGEPSPRVALLPLSRWQSKNWPLMSFARVARELQEARGASVYIMGAAGEQAACARIESALSGRVVNLAGQTSLPQMAGLLREMDLVIANDSGPMHLAAVMGAPVLALYGPSDPVRTGPPPGTRSRVLRGKLKCQPCFARTCRYGDVSCMQTITPESVVQVALEMLAGNLKSRHANSPAPGIN